MAGSIERFGFAVGRVTARAVASLVRRNRRTTVVDFAPLPLPERTERLLKLSERIGEIAQQQHPSDSGYKYKTEPFEDEPRQGEKVQGYRHAVRRGFFSGCSIEIAPQDVSMNRVEIASYSATRLGTLNAVIAVILGVLSIIAAILDWEFRGRGTASVGGFGLIGLIVGIVVYLALTLLTRPILSILGPSREALKQEMHNLQEGISCLLGQLGWAEVEPGKFALKSPVEGS